MNSDLNPLLHPLKGKACRVLITGMSGTGKSSVLEKLSGLGYRTVDTDSDEWSHWVTLPDGSADWVWREDAIHTLLANHREGALFVAGCKSNQGKFYPLFEHVVLLSAPADVILARIAARTNNPYGKSPEEREMILCHLAEVEPLLRATATAEIDASLPLDEVVRQVEGLVASRKSMRGNKMDIYQFTTGDIEESLSIMREAAQWLSESGMPMWNLNELNRDALGKSPGEFIVMYDENGNGIATLILDYEGGLFWPDVSPLTSGFIHKLAVRRTYAGKGMARRLIDYAASVCREKRMTGIRLDCDPHRKGLCHFYENCGFILKEVKSIHTPRMGRIDVALYKMDL